MILYAHTITTRLRYIADFIGREIGKKELFRLTDDKDVFIAAADDKINYSEVRLCTEEFYLKPRNLLFENDIQPQRADCFALKNYKAIFGTEGDFPFDIFAACFYLISRYEEYLPHKKDLYGRYAHENSLAFRENFLHRPLVNIWMQDFRAAILEKFPDRQLPLPEPRLPFLPTYDIDQAYSYKYKSLVKNSAGLMRSALAGEWQQVRERLAVLSGKHRDPFDAYQWMDQLHDRYKLKPFYFFILAGKTGRYDKNIPPAKPCMRQLVLQHFGKYHTGIHPSWQSGDEIALLKKEIQTLEQITGQAVINSRQHYIRFSLPGTFRQLADSGIRHDFSMGYGSINGFRASAASEFYWFDLEKNESSNLILYPFCYMDANSFFEQACTPQQAYEEMRQFYEAVKPVNGTMISIWHNNFLGTDTLYGGWRDVYEKFIAEFSGYTPSASGKAGTGVL